MDEQNDRDPAEPPSSPRTEEPADEPETPAEAEGPPELDPSSEPPGALPHAGEGLEFVLPEWLSFLQNRVILGGLAAVIVLLLVAIVLVAFDGSGDSEGQQAVLAGTPDADATPGLGGEFAGRIRVTTTLRNGPGTEFAILGTLPSGAVVSVIGRNEDSTWLQIVPQSGVPGWVPADVVEIAGDVSQLAVGAPGRGPSVAVPTQPPIFDEPPVIPTRIIPEEEEGPLPPEVPPPPTRPPPTRPPTPTSPPAPTVPPPTPTPVPPTPTPGGTN